ncbi:GT-D fold domain-containing glycosyltransferase [Aquibacillus sediminis]|uniref:GT-D fold domain-containing protein n=1 Tax=Aquibacillus sediminis TaxID=2574734 RepID=UPI001108D5AD|nr:GT-D fold domain-containing glycosyltransferase [Aquibacillus sediminis]
MHNFSSEEWEKLKKFGHVECGNTKNIAAEGLYYGGDKLVEDNLNRHQFLPYNIEEIITAGIDALKDHKINLKNAQEVAEEIETAVTQKNGYSVVRLGDGELLFLSHDVLHSSEVINDEPRLKFLSYAGVQVPNHQARDQLLNKLRQADVIGIPKARFPTFQNLFTKLANYHQWDLSKMPLTSSIINFELVKYTTILNKLLQNYKVLLIGNRMEEAQRHFQQYGYKNIVGNIPVQGIEQVSNVIEQAESYQYDVALVSAGIPATLICPMLAKKQKVAIDFGHSIDVLLDGNHPIMSLEKNNMDIDTCCQVGYYYFIRQDFETAIYWYKQALNHTITNQLTTKVIAHLRLSLCYWELGNVERASYHNEKAGQIDPNNKSVQQNRVFFNKIYRDQK